MEIFRFKNGKTYANDKYVLENIVRVGNRIYDSKGNRYQIKVKYKLVEVAEEYVEVGNTKIYSIHR